jgi:hypothetical protein
VNLRIEIVEDGGFVAALDQEIDQMRANEPGTTSD